MAIKPLSPRAERQIARELLRREAALAAGGVAAIPTEVELEKAKTLRALLSEGQDKFFFQDRPGPGERDSDTKKRKRIRRTGRRWGKTTGHAIKWLVELLLNPRGVYLYMDISSTDIRDKIWPEFLRLIAEHDLPFSPKETTLRIVHNRSTGRVLCRGASDRAKVEKLRGLGIGGNFRGAGIDESESFGANMAKLVMSVVSPGLRDRRGELLLTGTPGYFPEGLFYEASNGLRKNWLAYPPGTCQDNPFLDPEAKDFDLIIEEEGLSGYDDPVFIREWKGEYCINESIQMFSYDPRLNNCKAAPKGLLYIGCLDFGWVDESSLNVIGYSPFHKHIYGVYSWSASHQDSDAIAEQMQLAAKQFKIEKWVGDTGGGKGGDGSKRIANQLLLDYGYYIEPAKKNEKLSYVQFLNSAFRRREAWVVENSGPLGAEIPKVLWNPEKTDASKRAVDNNTMAYLYGWRAAKNLAGKETASVGPITDPAEKAAGWPEEETEAKVALTKPQDIDLDAWYEERLFQ